MEKQSVMSVATMAQQTPPINRQSQRSGSLPLTAPAMPNNPSVSNTGLITRTNGLAGTKASIR
jgi:hypothetical protein